VIARRRPDVEDRAATARHHLLNGAGGQVDDGLDVDAHLGDLIGDRGSGDRADRADAHVVHEDVEGQAAIGDGVEKARAGVGVGDVTGDHLDTHRLSEFFCEFAEFVLPAGHQCDAVPTDGQFSRDVGADTRRGTGDDGSGGRRRGW